LPTFEIFFEFLERAEMEEDTEFLILRGKSIHEYARLEQSLCSVFKVLSDMSHHMAATVFLESLTPEVCQPL
jgi:hypothetical protein